MITAYEILMMKIFIVISTLVLAGFLMETRGAANGLPPAAAGDRREASVPDKTPERESEKKIMALNDLAMRLYCSLRHSFPEKENLVLSPFSIVQSLSLAYVGARGMTAKQMAATLELPADPRDSARLFKASKSSMLTTATGIWLQRGFQPLDAYVQVVRKDFEAEMDVLDFRRSEESTAAINDWVSRSTRGKIPVLLERIEPGTIALLGSVIHFHGKWDIPFRHAETSAKPFFLSEEKTKTVPMMHANRTLEYAELEDCTIIDLPYEGGCFSMLVFLPRETTAMEEFETVFRGELLLEWNKKRRFHPIALSIPKFEAESTLSLAATLKSMGLENAFGPSADFSGMAEADNLMLGQVQHQAGIRLDEEGTEAVAATSVAVLMKSGPPPRPIVIEVNRPFVYMIRDTITQMILFVGTVSNPEFSP